MCSLEGAVIVSTAMLILNKKLKRFKSIYIQTCLVEKLEAMTMAHHRHVFTPPPNPYHPTYHSTYVPRKQPAVNSELDWLNSSEAKQRGAAAKANAISQFKKRFPNADMSRLEVQVDFDANHKATGAVYFRESKDSLANPFLIDRKYWTQAMKDALGMHQDGGLPFQLSITKQNNPTKPIPAVDFSKKKSKQALEIS